MKTGRMVSWEVSWEVPEKKSDWNLSWKENDTIDQFHSLLILFIELLNR